MLKRYAIIDGVDVVNVVEYESDPGSPPPGFPESYIAVQEDSASPGWKYEGGVFTNPNPFVQTPLSMTAEEKLAASGLTVDELKTLLGLK